MIIDTPLTRKQCCSDRNLAAAGPRLGISSRSRRRYCLAAPDASVKILTALPDRIVSRRVFMALVAAYEGDDLRRIDTLVAVRITRRRTQGFGSVEP